MSIPTLSVQMDLGDPSGTPTWSADLTPYVRFWSTRRGSNRELNRVEAGTAIMRLNNRSGRFTPEDPSSIFYPNLLPMRRVRIRATWNSVTYPIFAGFVESWPVGFPDVVDQTIDVSLVDGFKVLALASISGSFSQQLSGARVTAILDAAGWPAADRNINTGLSTIAAATLDNESALTHLQAVEHAEGGRLYIARDGTLTFLDRYAVLTGGSGYNFYGKTWSDDGTAMTYRDIVLTFDDTLLINDVRLTRTGGVEQVATDSASITKFFRRSFTETGVVLATDNEVSDFASWMVGLYGTPEIRAERIEDNAMGHDRWDFLLSLDIRDRVLVTKTPVGAGTISQDSFLEGISHDSNGQEWRTSVNVSPASNATGWLVLNDAVWGQLNSGKLGR
jgi:hypothetical protein